MPPQAPPRLSSNVGWAALFCPPLPGSRRHKNIAHATGLLGLDPNHVMSGMPEADGLVLSQILQIQLTGWRRFEYLCCLGLRVGLR